MLETIGKYIGKGREKLGALSSYVSRRDAAPHSYGIPCAVLSVMTVLNAATNAYPEANETLGAMTLGLYAAFIVAMLADVDEDNQIATLYM